MDGPWLIRIGLALSSGLFHYQSYIDFSCPSADRYHLEAESMGVAEWCDSLGKTAFQPGGSAGR